MTEYDDAGTERFEDEIFIPASTLYHALRAYYTTVAGDVVSDDDVRTVCRDYESKVKELAQALNDGFGVAFEYEHLLETTASVARSAIDEDPRLRHPLCPPS